MVRVAETRTRWLCGWGIRLGPDRTGRDGSGTWLGLVQVLLETEQQTVCGSSGQPFD